jgi:xanthosine utilization system XapX-like protein
MALLAVSGFADPLFAFLGYMGMKASAYMQPFTRKISSKIFKI